MLAKNKLNNIETLISQSLIGMDISHKECNTILNETDKYQKMKDDLRSKNKKSHESMRLSSVKAKT